MQKKGGGTQKCNNKKTSKWWKCYKEVEGDSV